MKFFKFRIYLYSNCTQTYMSLCFAYESTYLVQITLAKKCPNLMFLSLPECGKIKTRKTPNSDTYGV